MKRAISGISCNVVMDSRTDRDGLSKIYFRLKEGRVKRDIYTKVRWPREYFDRSAQQLMHRFHDDPDVTPSNLKLNEYKAIAHKLQLSGYLKNNQVTIDDLVKEFTDIGKKDDFFLFMELAAKELYNTDIIRYETWNRHKSTLNTLKLYYRSEKLPINKIDLDLIERFDAWCKKTKKKAHNTVCGYHKDIKKYLSIAVRKCLIVKNPYEDFSFRYEDGDRQALTGEELGRLYELYQDPELPAVDREICGRFLFSCFTGLRISDTSRITSNMIRNNYLVLVPHKGRDKGKRLNIPMPEVAMEIIRYRTGLIFQQFSHPYINERLKIIGALARIFKRLTYHCARDTFGTLFVEMGGDLPSLKDLMGHSSLKTTAIYLKMSDKRKEKLMGNFDKLMKKDTHIGL